ncbi:hypothetical protein [Oligoflexus tunisiensis]|uniref:hypothetical protein n=1 Tax=Oligoflexus tunisiensis TaxID=708132 RepID=UPI001C40316B|nr:hypothetical protein [Oligoflexus tunisiensis]
MALVACGSQPTENDSPVVKPESSFAADLMPLVAAYEAEAVMAGAPVAPEFRRQLVQVDWQNDLGTQGGETVLGRCERLNENHPDPDMRFRTIRIRRPDARGYVGSTRMDALTLRTVVYHELGHCLHDFRGHLPETTHQLMSASLPKERFQSFQALLQQHFSLLKTKHKH